MLFAIGGLAAMLFAIEGLVMPNSTGNPRARNKKCGIYGQNASCCILRFLHEAMPPRCLDSSGRKTAPMSRQKDSYKSVFSRKLLLLTTLVCTTMIRMVGRRLGCSRSP